MADVTQKAAVPVAGHGSHAPTSPLALALGSVGVVYGDIGTSPLYAFHVAVEAAVGNGPVTQDAVLGVLSLILWALTVVVTIKYVLILLRADNNGEGGTLALTALAARAVGRRTALLFTLGMIGAAMFYGDSVITPAISVLSAIEGLKLATPAFEHAVLPLTVVILIGLFAVQSHGTARVATMFGPVMLVWFLTLAGVGVAHLFDDPHVFAAANPIYAVRFLMNHGVIGLVTLGFVFLAVTGGEALYADLGHFGRKPIQLAWFGFGLPLPHSQLFCAGRLGVARPRSDRQSVLSVISAGAAGAGGRARDACHRHCQSGRHHGRLLGHPAGDPARSHSSARNSAHIRNSGRANLYSTCQYRTADRSASAGGDLSDVRMRSHPPTELP